jgi:hypothetical protein
VLELPRRWTLSAGVTAASTGGDTSVLIGASAQKQF